MTSTTATVGGRRRRREMPNRRARDLVGALLATATLLLIAPTAGPVHADPGPDDTADTTDEHFLAALRAAGLRYDEPDQAVKSGRTLCDLADAGKPDEEILSILVKHNVKLSDAHANKFMDIAYQSYCPQYLP